MDNFDEYFATHHDKKIPDDCTKLRKDRDCFDRNLARPCASCREFADLSTRYENYARRRAADDRRIKRFDGFRELAEKRHAKQELNYKA